MLYVLLCKIVASAAAAAAVFFVVVVVVVVVVVTGRASAFKPGYISYLDPNNIILNSAFLMLC